MTMETMPQRGSGFKERAGAVLFWLLLLLALLQPLQYLHLTFLEFSSGDEGMLLAGALRILHGQVPYQDFFFFVTPGSLYLIAGWLKLFGTTLAAARWLAWSVNALLVLGLALLGRAVKLSQSSLTLILLSQVALGFFVWPVVSHHWMVNACLAFSATCLVISREGERWGWLFSAGALAGAGGLVLQDEGAYWILVVILLLMLLGGERRWAKIGCFALGGFLVVTPLAAYLLAKTTVARILMDTVWIPLRSYHEIPVNRVTWGYGWLLPFDRLSGAWREGHLGFAASDLGAGIANVIVLFAFVVAGVLALFRMARFRRLSPEERWHWLVLVCFMGALVLMALHKPAALVLFFAFPGPFLLILWERERWEAGHPRAKHILLLTSLALPMTLSAVTTSLPHPYLRPTSSFTFPAGTLSTEEASNKPLWQLLHEFQMRFLKPGQSVFCYPYCSFYSFMLKTLGPMPYDNFDVGHLNPALVRNLLAQLKAHPPDWILLGGMYWPGDPIVVWIKSQYKPLAMCKGLLIVGRVPTVPPPSPKVKSHE